MEAKSIDTLEELFELQKKNEVPGINQVSLQVLLDYFEECILPYKYTFVCTNSLTIEFSIKKYEFCHLLYGTIGNIPNAKNYKGEEGYSKIKNNDININNLPSSIKNSAKDRLRHFMYLDVILENPKLIYFNPNIVTKGNLGIAKTSIDADFILYKDIISTNLLFFLKSKLTRTTEFISSVSFFPDVQAKYIANQIALKVIDKKKEKIINV